MILLPRDGAHDQYLGTEPARTTFAMALFLPLVATAAVAARFFARFHRGIRLAIDDWLVLLALVGPLTALGALIALTDVQIFHYCQAAGVLTCS